MDQLDFTRCRALNNVPSKKLEEILATVQNGPDTQEVKTVKLMAYNRYADSNLPIEYWDLKMEKDFIGDPRLKQKYDEYVSDLKKSYIEGSSFCLAGPNGVGKTMTMTSILKKACQKGYSCLYTTLSDVVSILTQASSEDKFLAKRELILVDFLVLDEWDNRFMSTDNAMDLYGRSFEGILRTRRQNKLPTLACTNSPNMIENFRGSLKASIGSVATGYMPTTTVFGEDFRKKTDPVLVGVTGIIGPDIQLSLGKKRP